MIRPPGKRVVRGGGGSGGAARKRGRPPGYYVFLILPDRAGRWISPPPRLRLTLRRPIGAAFIQPVLSCRLAECIV